jgi:hypothetical protein
MGNKRLCTFIKPKYSSVINLVSSLPRFYATVNLLNHFLFLENLSEWKNGFVIVSRSKVAVSIPDGVTGFFIYLINPTVLWALC